MIKIYFDGACEGSDPTGLLTYGYRIISSGNILITNVGGGVWLKPPPSTVSIAEYYALIEALKSALRRKLQNDPDHVMVYGDSRLVIEQMFGTWKFRKGPYILWAMKARKLVEKFPRIAGQWIPRDENYHCDHLAGIAWEKRSPERKRRANLLTIN